MVIRAVVLGAFEPLAGAVPGELRLFRERTAIHRELPFSAGFGALWTDDCELLALATGVGAARAAASVTALGLDYRFDLREALWLVTGVAGADPDRASLGSVVLPDFVVDGDLTHELDAREIPEHWPDGFVPVGKTVPYEQPRQARFGDDDGILFRLHTPTVDRAAGLASSMALQDSEAMAARRTAFDGAAAQAAPCVVRGDELASATFWHGEKMRERARRWLRYQTEGAGTYTISAMEDAGILTAIAALGRAGRADPAQVLIARGVSNFDGPRRGVSAAESLAETRVATYSAYRPALDNAWRVGHAILQAHLQRPRT